VNKKELTAPGSEQTFELTKDQHKLWKKAWTGPSCGHMLSFLLILPVYMYAFWLNMHGDMRLFLAGLVPGLATWVFMLCSVLVVWRERCQRSVRITANNVGLTFYSFGQPRSASWFDIIDICAASTNETVIITKKGTFFVPAETPWLDDFTKLVRSRAQSALPSTSMCMVATEGNRVSQFVLVVVLLLPFTFNIVKNLMLGVMPGAAEAVTAAIAIIVASLVTRKLRRIPIMVRANNEGLVIQDSDGERRYAWTQLRGTKTIGGAFALLRTTDGGILIPWMCYSPMRRSAKHNRDNIGFPEREQLLQLTDGKLIGRSST
jgi:hypothetical protein